jgi:dolichyl-phosphate beta-glucosyltransferase
MNPPDTLLVIPSYRDGDQLAAYLPELCDALASHAGGTVLQVVDDGSTPAEQTKLAGMIENARLQYPFLQPLIVSLTNRGKGHAIQLGWVTGATFSWLAFVDADGAVPATEVVALLALARQSPTPAVYIADRTASREKSVHRFWYRRLGSRLFNAWVRLCLGLGQADTQCGLKVIPAALQAGQPWREAGFAFDLELLLRARATGLPIITQPISWQEQPGSSLGPGAMLGLFVAAWRLRGGKGK